MLLRRIHRHRACIRGRNISHTGNGASISGPVDDGPPLPDPPYNLPHSHPFDVEYSGAFKKNWLSSLPALKPLVRNDVYLPSKEELWRAPTHQALETVIGHLPYHDALRYITEHSFFFLFPTVLRARDAPLPHIIYEDFMKSCTFASLQNPPEEQFALPSVMLRTLLCIAAYHCTLDPEYFTTCQMLFGRMEQQQQTTSEVLSAWVYCCTASGKVDEALTYAKYMADCDVPFDMTVFSLMQHPSLNPVEAQYGSVPHSAKGLLLQGRLSRRLQTVYSSDSVGVHGMFVYYALTLNHVRKWEVIRAAAALGITPSERTLTLAVEVFAREKGMRCGPKTVKALTLFLARTGSSAHLLYVLLRARKNELLPEFSGLSHAAFSKEEEELTLQCVERRARNDDSFAVAAPLVRLLVREDDPNGLLSAFARVARSRTPDSCETAPSCLSSMALQEAEVGQWSDVQASIRALLLDVDVLDKVNRRNRRHDNVRSGDDVVGNEMQPSGGSTRMAPVHRRREGEEEMQKLLQSDVPTGVRELARLNIVEELQEAHRMERMSLAWVNPDGTL